LDEELRYWLDLDDSAEHPLTAYDIGCDEGDAAAFMRKLWCGMQALPFAAGKWMVGIGTQVMEWALAFEVAEVLTPIAGVLSNVYELGFIGPINLVHFAWVATMFVVGLSLMTGRLSMGVRELATTALIFILGGMLLANPDGYLEGGRELAQNTSGAVLQAVDDAMADEPGDPEEIRGRLTTMLERAFVAEPYDRINWKEPLEGECAVARDRILQQGPWGSDETPRQIMRDHGCDAEADYNANPSDNRAMASVMVAGAAFVTTLLLLALALAVFVAQVTLVLLFSSASLVWVVALFPGARGVLWLWLSRLVWAVATTFVAVFLLAWVSITSMVVLRDTSDMNPTHRYLIIIVLALVAYKARGSVDRGLDGFSQRMATMMQRAQSPPSGPALPAVNPRPGAMSTSPFAAGVAGGLAAANAGRRLGHGVQRAPTLARGAVQASQATESKVRKAGRLGANVTKSAKKAGSTAVMAPVILPARIGQRQAARTEGTQDRSPRNDRVRARLAQARASRAQWRQNMAHPVRATRNARSNADNGEADVRDWM
jgi:hypothetical protein